MTQALICDGCGRIASNNDPTDDDPARQWWCLTQGPAPGGMLVMEALLATPVEALLAPEEEDEEPAAEGDDPSPERHFCSRACLVGAVLGDGEAIARPLRTQVELDDWLETCQGRAALTYVSGNCLRLTENAEEVAIVARQIVGALLLDGALDPCLLAPYAP